MFFFFAKFGWTFGWCGLEWIGSEHPPKFNIDTPKHGYICKELPFLNRHFGISMLVFLGVYMEGNCDQLKVDMMVFEGPPKWFYNFGKLDQLARIWVKKLVEFNGLCLILPRFLDKMDVSSWNLFWVNSNLQLFSNESAVLASSVTIWSKREFEQLSFKKPEIFPEGLSWDIRLKLILSCEQVLPGKHLFVSNEKRPSSNNPIKH